jgi:hypothetical protein
MSWIKRHGVSQVKKKSSHEEVIRETGTGVDVMGDVIMLTNSTAQRRS